MRRLIAKLHILRRLTAMLCVLLLLCALLPTASVAADSSLSWYVYNGLLVIDGQGAIPDYTATSPAPWHDQRDSILHVSISEGVTAIGDMAFYECSAMVSVSLPDSVTAIGDMAFAGCESLSTMRMPQVKTIGRAAFSRCFDLRDVILPATLTTIGEEAFYRCETLTYLNIPASVTSVGGEAFAYCSSLLQVNVEANLTALPEWCFYGCEQLVSICLPASVTVAGDSAFTRCDSLDVVYYTGDDKDREALVESIASGLPGFTTAQISSTDQLPSSTENKVTVSNNNNTYDEITTTVTQKGDTLLSVQQTVTYPSDGVSDAEKFDSTIHATVQSNAGWDVLMEELRTQGNHKTTFEISHGEQGPVQAEVMLYQDLLLSGDWLKDLTGQDAVVTIITPNGSRFSINGLHITGYEFEDSYDLNYTLVPYRNVSMIHRNVLGSAVCYWLSFRSAFTFPVTVEVFLDPYATNQNATLYECDENEQLTLLNSVAIDEEGYVGFPLRVINTSTRYLLAINVPTVRPDDVLNPDAEALIPVSDQYAFTEPRGFMGMTMQEFTRMIVTIVCVFFGVVLVLVLFFVIRSKRKAKMAALRAEVLGTDALEEYDSEEGKKKRKKFSFKKASKEEKEDAPSTESEEASEESSDEISEESSEEILEEE